MAHVYTMYPICVITVVLVASVQCGMTGALVNTTSPPSPILLSKSLLLIVVGAAECNSIYYIQTCNTAIFLLAVVHGITGSQLEANVQGAAQSLCNTGGDYELLWVNLVKLAKLIVGINCLDHGLK